MASSARPGFLTQAGQCLVGLVQAQTTSDIIDVLETWLSRLPILWYTTDLFEADRRRKRVSSRKCPRGFESFIGRFNVRRRQDGMYQGKLGNVLLLMVKASHPTIPDQFLVCAIGLPRRSYLNDAATLGCLGGLIYDGLSRVFLLETLSRRAALLEACANLTQSTVAALERTGTVVECYSPTPAEHGLHPRVIDHIRDMPARRNDTVLPVLVGGDGDGFGESRQQWLPRDPVLDNSYAGARVTPPTRVSLHDSLRGYNLSQRELEVAHLIFEGRTNKVIADTLFISRDTVKTHCRRIFAKMGITRRTQALGVLGRQ